MILTDSYNLLQEPVNLPPLKVDSDKTGKDSDHKGVQCIPRNYLVPQGGKLRNKLTVQRFPETKIVEFGFELVNEG